MMTKKTALILCLASLALLFAACEKRNVSEQIITENPPIHDTEEPTSAVFETSAGKIAIITAPFYQNRETYTSARQIVDKYGKDKVIHRTWPDMHRDETEQVISIVAKLGADPEIKAIIASDVVYGMSAGFEKLRETRPDIFIASCGTQDIWLAQIANLIFGEDSLGMCQAIVEQAQNMGAKAFVYYSSSYLLAYPVIFEMRKRIKESCEKLNIEFVNAEELNMPSALISLNVDKYIQNYGKDTAFYCPGFQGDIIGEVVKAGAILPQAWGLSPYRGFPVALGINWPDGKNFHDVYELLPLDYFISEASRIAAEKGITGRLSTWPVPLEMMSTIAGAEYAIKWLDGEVPKKGVDIEVLRQLMEDYAGVKVYLTPYTDKYPYTADVDTEVMQQIRNRAFIEETYFFPYTDEYPYPYTDRGAGETYDNFLLMRMDHITF